MVDKTDLASVADFTTVEPGHLRIITSDIAARPMSFISEGVRQGFEPALTRVVCDRLGLEPVWFNVPLRDFYSSLSSGRYDVIWFNQVITQERRAWADFSRPYGRFDSGVLVRDDSEIDGKSHLQNKRVGVLRESVSTRLLELLPPDIEPVYFDGHPDVKTEILQALVTGQIDAVVEDSLVLMALEAQDRRVRCAFEIPTHHPFGIAVLPGNRELVDAFNGVLNSLIVDGTLHRLWGQWIPYKPYPF
jgi:ABC-type amino acid transport substrate-binding protein